MALIMVEFLTLDGVMQDPDGAEGTPYGGWAFRHGPAAVAGDKFGLGALLDTGTLLFGRGTWEHFTTVWPGRSDEFARRLNAMPKLVASRHRTTFGEWHNSVRFEGDVLAEVDRVRRTTDLILIGSTSLAHQLIGHAVVDEYRLLIFPSIAADGRRLFTGGKPTDLDLVGVEQKDAAVLITYRTPGSLCEDRS